MDITLRPADPGDAAGLLALKRQLDTESTFMLLRPDERGTSVAAVEQELASTAASPNSVVIVADAGDELLGYVELTGGEYARNRTTAYLVIGVLAKAGGKGLGGRLLREARGWAAAHGIHRIELTVMAHNERAAALYEGAGFSVEGRRRECLHIDGTFVDELYMAVILS